MQEVKTATTKAIMLLYDARPKSGYSENTFKQQLLFPEILGPVNMKVRCLGEPGGLCAQAMPRHS